MELPLAAGAGVGRSVGVTHGVLAGRQVAVRASIGAKCGRPFTPTGERPAEHAARHGYGRLWPVGRAGAAVSPVREVCAGLSRHNPYTTMG